MSGTAHSPELARDLARIHAAAFAGQGRAWSTREIEDLCAEPSISLRVAPDGGGQTIAGFALFRTAADEAELLTLAVAPDSQRKGLGRSLLADVLTGAREAGAARLFLEVAAGNSAARALYAGAGFQVCGTRSAYYLLPDGRRDDALVLECALPPHKR